MSKAEELAKRLSQLANLEANEVADVMNESAHELSALAASHQRLKEALEAIKAKAGRPDLVYLIAKLALEQAKDLE